MHFSCNSHGGSTGLGLTSFFLLSSIYGFYSMLAVKLNHNHTVASIAVVSAHKIKI